MHHFSAEFLNLAASFRMLGQDFLKLYFPERDLFLGKLVQVINQLKEVEKVVVIPFVHR